MAVVVVVGASRGIGAAVVSRFAEAGDTVVATNRDLPPAVTGVGPRVGVRCDVRSTSSVDAAFTQIEAQCGFAEIVVVNAGITADDLTLRMDDETWHATLNTNLSGAFRVVRRAIRPMVQARAGSIVLVSSVAGSVGVPGQANYAASKAGLVGLGRSVAREVAGRGVRVNIVAPGPTETDMTGGLSERQREAMRGLVPMGRYASAAEIAAVIESVARATFMTGAVVAVDGGASMGM